MPTIVEDCITPELAKRRVSQFIIIGAGDRLYGGNPEEYYDASNKLYWLVPVMLAIPGSAERTVGQILVESSTGQLQIGENTINDILTNVKSVIGDA